MTLANTRQDVVQILRDHNVMNSEKNAGAGVRARWDSFRPAGVNLDSYDPDTGQPFPGKGFGDVVGPLYWNPENTSREMSWSEGNPVFEDGPYSPAAMNDLGLYAPAYATWVLADIGLGSPQKIEHFVEAALKPMRDMNLNYDHYADDVEVLGLEEGRDLWRPNMGAPVASDAAVPPFVPDSGDRIFGQWDLGANFGEARIASSPLPRPWPAITVAGNEDQEQHPVTLPAWTNLLVSDYSSGKKTVERQRFSTRLCDVSPGPYHWIGATRLANSREKKVSCLSSALRVSAVIGAEGGASTALAWNKAPGLPLAGRGQFFSERFRQHTLEEIYDLLEKLDGPPGMPPKLGGGGGGGGSSNTTVERNKQSEKKVTSVPKDEGTAAEPAKIGYAGEAGMGPIGIGHCHQHLVGTDWDGVSHYQGHLMLSAPWMADGIADCPPLVDPFMYQRSKSDGVWWDCFMRVDPTIGHQKAGIDFVGGLGAGRWRWQTRIPMLIDDDDRDPEDDDREPDPKTPEKPGGGGDGRPPTGEPQVGPNGPGGGGANGPGGTGAGGPGAGGAGTGGATEGGGANGPSGPSGSGPGGAPLPGEPGGAPPGSEWGLPWWWGPEKVLEWMKRGWEGLPNPWWWEGMPDTPKPLPVAIKIEPYPVPPHNMTSSMYDPRLPWQKGVEVEGYTPLEPSQKEAPPYDPGNELSGYIFPGVSVNDIGLNGWGSLPETKSSFDEAPHLSFTKHAFVPDVPEFSGLFRPEFEHISETRASCLKSFVRFYNEVSVPTITFSPWLSGKDSRYVLSPGKKLQDHALRSPISLRIEAFGAEANPCGWTYTQRPSEGGRYAYGTVSGGINISCPERSLDGLSDRGSTSSTCVNLSEEVDLYHGEVAATGAGAGSVTDGWKWSRTGGNYLNLGSLASGAYSGMVQFRPTLAVFNQNVQIRADLTVSGSIYFGSLAAPTDLVSSATVSRTQTMRDRDLTLGAHLEDSAISGTVSGATLKSYRADTSSAPVIINLPAVAAANAGDEIEVIDASGNSSANSVTINRAGSDTVRGATSYVVDTDYGSVRLRSDGASVWHVVSEVTT